MAKKYNVNQLLKDLIKNLESKRIEVYSVILFGSYARGNPKRYSDIDIAIISPNFRNKSILKRQELLGEAIFPLMAPIEALGYSPDELKSPSPLSFPSEILATGKLIYKKY